MIKLILSPKPKKLTPKLEKELTEKYKNEGTDVWKRKFLIEAVAAISNNKCAFSEIKLGEESKYMEIEHFHPKSLYEDEVVTWGNLLPSCKKCNGTKGNLDTKKYPIINPFIDNPKEHIYLKRSFRLYHKTEKGKRTIQHTALNDRKHFVKKRFKIGSKIEEKVDIIENSLQKIDFSDEATQGDIKNLITRFKNTLSEGERTEEYAATISTVILEDDSFYNIKNLLIKNSLWDEELIELEKELCFCSLMKTERII